MNANELADELEHYLKGEEYDRLVWEIPDLLRQQQAKLEKLQALLREYTALNMRQQAEIEASKLQLHTTLTNRNLEKPAVEDVMEKYCTCYKLGYSPLNDYALVKQK